MIDNGALRKASEWRLSLDLLCQLKEATVASYSSLAERNGVQL